MRVGQAIVAGLLVAGGLATRNATAASLMLTCDGQPAATIVLAEKPTKAAQFAAFELRWHVKAISGATLPIVRDAATVPAEHVKVYVGDGPRARTLGLTQEGFKLQEYAMRAGKGEIVLVGKDAADFAAVTHDLDALNDARTNANWPDFWEEQGTLHAVYDFLRDACGVRWFNPTDTGTLIRSRPTLTVAVMDQRRAPSFRYRDAMWMQLDSYDREVSLWQNEEGKGPKEEGFKAWCAAAYTNSSSRYGNDASAKRQGIRLFLLRMKNGGERCYGSHSLCHYSDLYWAPSKSAEAAKYFMGKRPELFAQGYDQDPPPQLCYTRTDVVSLVAQEARDYFDKGGYPYKTTLCMAPLGQKWGANFFSVEAMDNSSFCKCAECQKWHDRAKDYGNVEFYSKGMNSDYWFNFVNQVAVDLKKTHPEKHIVTLAYMTHAYPPKSVKLDPGVAVQFCFASDSAPWTPEYRHELGLMRAWGEEAKSSGRALYTWCFLGHGSRSGARFGNYNGFPPYIAHAIGAEMKLYKQLGYRGQFQGRLPTEVDAYVLFRLTDNADLDVDALLEEYFSGLYGAAGTPLKKLYLAMETLVGDPEAHPKQKGVSGQESDWGYLGTAERMAEYGTLVDEARRLAKTDWEKHNVELFELSTWKYMTEGRAQYLKRAEAAIPAVRAPAVPDAGGDPAKVAWDQAAVMAGSWYRAGSGELAQRKLSGRLAHDGNYLYMELTDPCATKKLECSPVVAPCDDWELFLAAQRGSTYRQFMIGPTGGIAACLNGEINGRMYEPYLEHGIKVVSDASAPDRWVTRLSLPLRNAVPGGAVPGGKVFLNVVRVSSPAVVGNGGSLSIDTWVPFTMLHEVDRLAEVTLVKP